jgi:hypothetical protein
MPSLLILAFSTIMRSPISFIPLLLVGVTAQSTTTSSALGRATAEIHNLAVAITDDTLTQVRNVMKQLCVYR